MRDRAAELEQVRAARAAANRALQRKVARLQVRQGALRAASARIIGAIRAEEAARRGRRCWPMMALASGARTPTATSG